MNNKILIFFGVFILISIAVSAELSVTSSNILNNSFGTWTPIFTNTNYINNYTYYTQIDNQDILEYSFNVNETLPTNHITKQKAISQIGSLWTTEHCEKNSGCYYFNGTASFIRFPNNLTSFNLTNNFEACLVTYIPYIDTDTTTTQYTRGLISSWNFGANTGIELRIFHQNISNSFDFIIGSGDTYNFQNSQRINNSAFIETYINKTLYICGVLNNGQMLLYVNGISVGINSVNNKNLTESSSAWLQIGHTDIGPGKYFDGYIDSVEIRNYTTTTTQKLERYNSIVEDRVEKLMPSSSLSNKTYSFNVVSNNATTYFYSNYSFYITDTRYETACFGDSITGSWATESYCRHLNDTELFNTHNYGVSGDHWHNLTDRISNVTGKGYDYTVLLVGTNDRGDTDKVPYYINGIMNITTQIKADGQQVLISTIPPANVSGGEPTNQSQSIAINDMVRRTSYNQQICYADIFTDVFDSTWNSSLFRDTLHPNAAAQYKMNSTYYNALQTCVLYDCRSNPATCYNYTNEFPETTTKEQCNNNTLGLSAVVTLLPLLIIVFVMGIVLAIVTNGFNGAIKFNEANNLPAFIITLLGVCILVAIGLIVLSNIC